MQPFVRVIPLLLLTCLVAACGYDLEDDHVVINGLPALGENDTRVVLLDRPAEPVDCVILSGCNAGSAVSGTYYGIIGDVDKGMLAARDEIRKAWEYQGEVEQPFDEPMLFQFPDEVDTSTGTAFLRLEFIGEWDIGSDEPIEHVFAVTISTHELSD